MKFHAILLFVVFVVRKSFPKVTNVIDVDKIEFCSALNCREDVDSRVCGIRPEGEGFRLKLFLNECKLLKYGCSVDEANAYGLINTEYCDRLFGTDESDDNNKQSHEQEFLMSENRKLENNVRLTDNASRRSQNVYFNATNKCNIECDEKENTEVCGIREDGVGYRIRLFDNYCELTKHNCETDQEFIKTDLFICKAIDRSKDAKKDNITGKVNKALNSFKNNTEDDLEILNGSTYEEKINDFNKTDVKNNLIVVNSKIFGQYDNLNDSIDTFFAASHVFHLPLKEVPFSTRRKMLKYAGPVKVFVPWIEKPSNISNDTFHRPTLSSCYHKCPFKCPDTYAPVCGVPGIVAREPSLMFQNHCFMDVAQCKMFWENKSSTAQSSYTYAPVCGVPGIVAREPSLMFQNHCFMDVAQCKMFWENKSSTAQSSSYVESSFLFCMGDEMNAVYRFLPAIRTLQRMGRLKKKGKFRAILRNFKFVSEFRYGRPKFMGRK